MLKSSLILLIAIGLSLSNCQPVKAPLGFVPKRKGTTTNAFGGWMSISFLDSTRQELEGEFIAVSNDSLYIMDGDKVNGRKTAEVRFARIILFNTDASGYAAWTVLNSLGTISTGTFLVFMFPLAFVTGIMTTVSESRRINFYEYPLHDWSTLRKYARFPQGIPEGVDLHELKPQVHPVK
jgi:hypothetical protein